MTHLGKRMAVAIPDTLLEERDSPREKTEKLGGVARTCAIHGVDLVEVYRDPGGRGESRRIKKVLEYLETPQYLRRRIFPFEEELRYAGLLPPLRTPSHKPKISLEQLSVGEVREGVTNSDGTVDIGLDRAPALKGMVAGGRRITVRVTSKNPLTAEVVSREDAGVYWGFEVEIKSLDDVLSDPRFGMKIATSRLGSPLGTALPRLREAVAGTAALMLLFGAPSRGLLEIVGQSLPERVDFVINLYPEQHVETVRTEEALSAALDLVGFLLV